MAIIFTDNVGRPYNSEDLKGLINLDSGQYTVDLSKIDETYTNDNVVQFDRFKLNACDQNYFDHYFNELDRSQTESIGKLIGFS